MNDLAFTASVRGFLTLCGLMAWAGQHALAAEPPGLWQGRRQDWKITPKTRMIETDRRFGAAEIWRWKVHDSGRPKPLAVEPKPWNQLEATARPPRDAVVLFGGIGTEAWEAPGWKVEEGCLVATPRNGDLVTKDDYGSCRLHVEWMLPPEAEADKQARPRTESSGILFMSTYEVHIPESNIASTSGPADARAGAIFGQYAPTASAMRPAGHWQSMDVNFHRPVFDSTGECIVPARVTVDLNGVRVQDSVELSGPTIGPTYRRAYAAHPDRLPLRIRMRNPQARFRNLWLAPLTDPAIGAITRPAAKPATPRVPTLAEWKVITAETRMIESDRRFGSAQMWRYGFNDPTCPRPRRVDPKPEAERAAAKPPPGAIVLFDGVKTDAWKPPVWDVENGCLVVTPKYKSLFTKEGFGSCRLHVEWMAPPRPDPHAKWASPGNSGVVLMSTYEIQILDHFEAEHLVHADALAGAVYGQYPPSVSPIRPPGQWQSFDIEFHQPAFDAAGECIRPARVTLDFNGVRVQDNVELSGPTRGPGYRRQYMAHPDKLPLELQNHNARVFFRNIWIVPLTEPAK